jgi:hypothetical protein
MRLKDDKLLITSRRRSIAIVPVWERTGLARLPIDPALVPGDKGITNIDDGHFNSASSVYSGVRLRSGQEFTAEPRLLQSRINCQ